MGYYLMRAVVCEKMKMTTMTMSKEPVAKKETTVPAKKISVTPEQHAEVVKSFVHECYQVEFLKSSGLPTSRQASEQAVKKVADDAEGDESAFTVSKRLLSCDHPIIDSINEWARKVTKWRDTFTFPMAASAADARTVKKAKGKRLIRKEDVEEFENGMVQLEEEGIDISQKLFGVYDTLMSLEKKRLGKEFNSSDYPPQDQVYQEYDENKVDPDTLKVEKTRVRVGALRIGGRDYNEVTAPVELPKAIVGRMMAQSYEKLNHSVEVVVADMAKTLAETFMTLSGQLVDRVKISPRFGSPMYKSVGAEAEVLTVKTSQEDDSIEEGSVMLLLAYKVTSKEQRKQTVKEEFGPFTEKEYQELRPSPMDSTKKLTTSVVERVGEYLETFSNLKSKLGAYGEHVDEALDALRELYHRAKTGSKKEGAEGVIESVKYSSKLRAELREGLESVCETLGQVAEEAKQVRRKLHGSIVAQVVKAGKKAK